MSTPDPDIRLLTYQPIAPSEGGLLIPALVERAGKRASDAFFQFFAAEIPNANTRESYLRDVSRFFTWCQERGFDIMTVTPIHVAGYREHLRQELAATSVKRHFSALRMLYSYWVERGVLERNPVREVKTEKVSRSEGKTPALSVEDMRKLFESFDTESLVGLRDRAFIAVMAYTFARVSAVCNLKAKDYIEQGRTTLLRFREKGGKEKELPCHHLLELYLDEYIEKAGITEKEAVLFPAAKGKTGILGATPLARTDAWAMVRRRLRDAGIPGDFSNHTFRATGITTFLENGGTIEAAQFIAGHADSRTTKLYDKRAQKAALEDLERVRY
ncbi:MAG TPA: tyrosine-type recombinase/integrase [Fimbriimonadaceae bacterium]|jgi:integrase/recombinase XerD|nr:tyrosine-type recombinase/integrase [Fimbriimonadaceae bacterium]